MFIFVRLLDDLLQQFVTGNRWNRTCINYHPCITSEPTNPTVGTMKHVQYFNVMVMSQVVRYNLTLVFSKTADCSKI